MYIEQTIFDSEFKQKLKSFYSFDETKRYDPVTGQSDGYGFRRTGRTHILAQTLLETAIESNREIKIQDHYVGARASDHAVYEVRRRIEDIASQYSVLGINLDLKFGHRYNTFKASIISGHEIYNRIRVKPFPVITRKVEFLNEELLLLL